LIVSQFDPVIRFWFEEISPQQWWIKEPSFDALICQRFAHLHRAAAAGELSGWRNRALGRLAEIIILDQFSRNIYRGQAQSFACDAMALTLSREAISQGVDGLLTVDQRLFLYMPFMHSESVVVHQQAMTLFDQPGLEDNLEFEKQHKAIIDRFGRYPHRNTILGRPSTDEEKQFLRQPGSSF
jgi:uncharacterized protein (DUF924 family)